jgi:hypothetical protein
MGGIVDFARVYEGYPYPSDILGSMVWASGRWVCSKFILSTVWRVVAVEQIRRSWFYLRTFLLTYQVATLFDDIRLIGRGPFFAALQHASFGSMPRSAGRDRDHAEPIRHRWVELP